MGSPQFVLLRYPDSWYRDITSNKKFFSLAATYRGAIVGMIVAEIKSRTKIHKEVSTCGEEWWSLSLHGPAKACDQITLLLSSLALSSRSPDRLGDSYPVGFFLGIGDSVRHALNKRPSCRLHNDCYFKVGRSVNDTLRTPKVVRGSGKISGL